MIEEKCNAFCFYSIINFIYVLIVHIQIYFLIIMRIIIFFLLTLCWIIFFNILFFILFWISALACVHRRFVQWSKNSSSSSDKLFSFDIVAKTTICPLPMISNRVINVACKLNAIQWCTFAYECSIDLFFTYFGLCVFIFLFSFSVHFDSVCFNMWLSHLHLQVHFV